MKSQRTTVSGMTCVACEYKIKHVFKELEGVVDVEVDGDTGAVTLHVETEVSNSDLKTALLPYPKYGLDVDSVQSDSDDSQKSWVVTYRPLLTVVGFIVLLTAIQQYRSSTRGVLEAMNTFMGGFFVAFSFFKLLDVKGFADAFSMYDIIAKRNRFYGLLYPFIELSLGVFYLTGWYPFLTNGVTFLIMSIGLIGVINAVRNKQRIQCACLGTGFNLPMTTVTIIENSTMAIMAVGMLLLKMNVL